MEIAPLSSRNVSRIDKRLHLPWKSPRCCGRARYAHGQRLWAEDGRSSEQWIQWTGSFNSTHNNNEDCVKQFKVYEFHRSRYMKWYKSSWSNVIDWSQTYRFPYSAKLSHYTKVTSAIETYSNNLPTTCLQLPHGQFLGKYRLCSFIHSERFAVHGFASEDLACGSSNQWLKYPNSSLIVVHVPGLCTFMHFRDSCMYFRQSISTSVYHPAI
jgi:hypothetical protein